MVIGSLQKWTIRLELLIMEIKKQKKTKKTFVEGKMFIKLYLCESSRKLQLE